MKMICMSMTYTRQRSTLQNSEVDKASMREELEFRLFHLLPLFLF
jgi:hypothetical protein